MLHVRLFFKWGLAFPQVVPCTGSPKPSVHPSLVYHVSFCTRDQNRMQYLEYYRTEAPHPFSLSFLLLQHISYAACWHSWGHCSISLLLGYAAGSCWTQIPDCFLQSCFPACPVVGVCFFLNKTLHLFLLNFFMFLLVHSFSQSVFYLCSYSCAQAAVALFGKRNITQTLGKSFVKAEVNMYHFYHICESGYFFHQVIRYDLQFFLSIPRHIKAITEHSTGTNSVISPEAKLRSLVP